MTKEQAISIIRQECLCVDRDCNIEKNCGNCDLAMPSKEPILEAYNMAIKTLNQEPCTDAISRQAVLEALTKTSGIRGDALKALYDLPSVTPEEKVGHWITLKDEYGDVCEAVCSSCDSNGNHKWAYCPYCGVKMQASPTGEESEG